MQPPMPQPAALKQVMAPVSDGEEGKTMQQICEQFQISFSNLSRNAKAKGQNNLEYLRDQTGKNWVQRGKRYYLLGE